MQPGAPRDDAKIKIRLYLALPPEEGEELAEGSLDLRSLWEDARKQDLQRHQLELVDASTRESSYVSVSTSVLPALTRLLGQASSTPQPLYTRRS